MASSTNNLTLILGVADAQLQAGIKRAQRAIRGLGRESEVTEKRTSRAMTRMAVKTKASMGTARKSVARFSEAVRTSIVNLRFLATFFAGGALMIGVVKFSSQFERALANVNTLLDGSGVKIERYKQQLLELSTRSSKDLMDLSQALYQIVSAGIPAIEGLGGAYEFLERAQAAAVAGLADTEEAANAMLSFVSAYKAQGLTAARAADILQRTVELGRTTWPQLAHAIGRVTPLAAQFGMSAEEVGASLVVLTRAGVNTNEAVTGMRAVINNLAKPTEKGRKVLNELGLEFDSASIKSKGFSGVLSELYEETGGNIELMGQLFPNIRALLPVVVQAGEDFHLFNETLKEMEDSSGAVDNATKKIENTFSHTLAILKSNFQRFLVDLGSGDDGVLERVGGFFESLSDSLVYGTSFLGMDVKEAIKGLLSSLVSLVQFVMGPLKDALEFAIVAIGVRLVASLGLAITRMKAMAATGLAGGMAALTASAAGAAQMAQGFAAANALGAMGGTQQAGFLARGASAGKSFIMGLVAAGAGPTAQAQAAAAGTVTAQSMVTATQSVLAGASGWQRAFFGLKGFAMLAMRAIPFLAIGSMFVGPLIDGIKGLFSDAEPEVTDAAKQMYDGILENFQKERTKIDVSLEITGGATTARLKEELKKLRSLEEEFEKKKDKLGEESLRKYRKRLDERVKAAREAFNEEKGLTVEGAKDEKEDVEKGKRFRVTGAQKDMLTQTFDTVATETFTLTDLINKEADALKRVSRASGKELDTLVAREKAIANVRRALLDPTTDLGKKEEALARTRMDVEAFRLPGSDIGGVERIGGGRSAISGETEILNPTGIGLLARQAELYGPGFDLETNDTTSRFVNVIVRNKDGTPVVDEEGNITYTVKDTGSVQLLSLDERLLGTDRAVGQRQPETFIRSQADIDATLGPVGRDTRFAPFVRIDELAKDPNLYDPNQMMIQPGRGAIMDPTSRAVKGGGFQIGMFRDPTTGEVKLVVPDVEKIVQKLTDLANLRAKEQGLSPEQTKALIKEFTSEQNVAQAIDIQRMPESQRRVAFGLPEGQEQTFTDPGFALEKERIRRIGKSRGFETEIEAAAKQGAQTGKIGEEFNVKVLDKAEQGIAAIRLEIENTAVFAGLRIETALKEGLMKAMFGVDLASATEEQIKEMNKKFKDLRILPTPQRQRRSFADVSRFVVMVNGEQKKVSQFLLENNEKLSAQSRTTLQNLLSEEQEYVRLVASGKQAAERKALLDEAEIDRLAKARGLSGRQLILFKQKVRSIREQIIGYGLLGQAQRENFQLNVQQLDALNRGLNAQQKSLEHDKKGAAIRKKLGGGQSKTQRAINALIRIRKKLLREVADMQAKENLEAAKVALSRAKDNEANFKKQQDRLISLSDLEGLNAAKNAASIRDSFQKRIELLNDVRLAQEDLIQAEIEDARRQELSARQKEKDKIDELAKTAKRTTKGRIELRRAREAHNKRIEAGEKKLTQTIAGLRRKLNRTLRDLSEKELDIEIERIRLVSEAEKKSASSQEALYQRRLSRIERFAKDAKRKINEALDNMKIEQLGAGIAAATAEAFGAAYGEAERQSRAFLGLQQNQLNRLKEQLKKAKEDVFEGTKIPSQINPRTNEATPILERLLGKENKLTPGVTMSELSPVEDSQPAVLGFKPDIAPGQASLFSTSDLDGGKQVTLEFVAPEVDLQILDQLREKLKELSKSDRDAQEGIHNEIQSQIAELLKIKKQLDTFSVTLKAETDKAPSATFVNAELAQDDIQAVTGLITTEVERINSAIGKNRLQELSDKIEQQSRTVTDAKRATDRYTDTLRTLTEQVLAYAGSAQAAEDADPTAGLLKAVSNNPQLKKLVDLLSKGSGDTKLFLESLGLIPNRLQQFGISLNDVSSAYDGLKEAGSGAVDTVSDLASGSLKTLNLLRVFKGDFKGALSGLLDSGSDFGSALGSILGPSGVLGKTLDKTRDFYKNFAFKSFNPFSEPDQKVGEPGKGNIFGETAEAATRTIVGAALMAMAPVAELVGVGLGNKFGDATKGALKNFGALAVLPFKKFGKEQIAVAKAIGVNLIADAIEAGLAFSEVVSNGMSSAMTGGFDKLTSNLVGSVTSFGDKIAGYTTNLVGSFFKGNKLLQKAFGKTIGPVMKVPGEILKQVNKVLLAPAMGAIKGSFDILFQGVSNAFSSMVDPSRLDSSLRERYRDIRKESREIIANLQTQAKTTKDVGEFQKIQGQIADEQAKQRKALREEKKKVAEGSPEKILEKAINQALEMIDKVAEKLPDLVAMAITALIENLPTIIEKAVAAFADVIAILAEKLPELVVTIVQTLIDALPQIIEALALLIPALFDALLQGVVLILQNIGPIISNILQGLIQAVKGILISVVQQLPALLNAIIQAIPDVITALVEAIPVLIEAVAEALPELVVALIAAVPAIIAALIKSLPRLVVALILLLPKVIASLITGIGKGINNVVENGFKPITDAWKWVIDALYSVGEFFRSIGRAFSDEGAGGTALRIGGGAAAGAAIGALGGPVGALIGAGVGGLVGGIASLFHDGGMVGASPRGGRQLAAALSAAGAPAFNTGGMVRRSVGDAIRRNMMGIPSRLVDDVPAVLQTGESVLNRRATSALGAAGVAALNSGAGIESGPTNISVSLNADGAGINQAAAALLPHLIKGVTVEAQRPGSGLRGEIRGSNRNMPIGSRGTSRSQKPTS